jgi:hypothetical protein
VLGLQTHLPHLDEIFKKICFALYYYYLGFSFLHLVILIFVGNLCLWGFSYSFGGASFVCLPVFSKLLRVYLLFLPFSLLL